MAEAAQSRPLPAVLEDSAVARSAWREDVLHRATTREVMLDDRIRELEERKSLVRRLAEREQKMFELDSIEPGTRGYEKARKQSRLLSYRQLLDVCRFYGANWIEYIETRSKKIPFLFMIGEKPLDETVQWESKNVEGITVMSIPGREADVHYALLCAVGDGTPLLTPIASASHAVKLIASGDYSQLDPHLVLGARLAIAEYEAQSLRKDLLISHERETTASEFAEELSTLFEEKAKLMERYVGETEKAPAFAGGGSAIQKMYRFMFTHKKGLMIAGIGVGLFVLAIGQSQGWWDIPGLKQIFGSHVPIQSLNPNPGG